jgi:threonylcarbamoyladenosine tRNA methylthiotransferase MtaB
VPALRGRSRSASVRDIIVACNSAAEAGFREIVLTGTHIGQFRQDGEYTLVNLLDEILATGQGPRIRLTSLDPRDLSEAVLDRISRHERLCPHLHLSVQSLDSGVLASMGRGDTGIEEIIARLAAVRAENPAFNIGGDFIVGFPGETEAMFERTMLAAEAACFTYGHVFRFSRRPGTPACDMAGQIPEAVKARRGERLRERLRNLHRCFIESQLGTRHAIIVEKTDPVSGMTGNYLRVRAPTAAAPRNSLLEVVIRELSSDAEWCMAEPVLQ